MMLQRTKGSVASRLVAALVATALVAAAAFALAGLALAAPDLQPKTTHPVQGRENCLTCHPVGGGVKPSPANHAAYGNAMCLGCHPAAAAEPAPAKPPAPPTNTPASREPAATPAASGAGPQPTPTGAPPTATPAPTSGESPKPTATQAAAAQAPSCMDCHKNPNLSMVLPSGEKLSLFVDEAEMAKSVHQGKLNCTDCHSRITGFPHKKIQVNSRREYSIAQYEACKRCHFANYTKTLDSMHYKLMEKGNQNAPLCTDCHGYHYVTDPDQPRSKISMSCAKCHKETYETYAKSVHGSALINEENKDVPLCTDCHGTHTIQDTASASFRLNSPEMCARCHADPAMMSRYGLSPNVFKTYAQDFHGATVMLTKKQGSDSWTNKAVCSDCHGVHNIRSVKKEDPALLRKEVMASCQKCHPEAGNNFPDAWLGHYELSLEKAPLPWLVRAWYVIFIPFMVGGLMLHIVVDLWRIARNR